MTVRAAVVVPAAGMGRRVGGVRKQYRELAGEPLLVHALRPFLEHSAVEWTVVALPAGDVERPRASLDRLTPGVRRVPGGEERGDSVRRALDAVPDEAEIVLIHDAARPLVTRAVIDRTLAAAAEGVGAVTALPATDTVKEVDDAGRVVATPERERLRRAQTPQAFPRAMIVGAYRRAAAEGVSATDDAALVERYGGTVVVVEGAAENFKVTTPADLARAETLLSERAERVESTAGATA